MIFPIVTAIANMGYVIYQNQKEYEQTSSAPSSNATLAAVAQKILKNPGLLHYRVEENLTSDHDSPAKAQGSVLSRDPVVIIDSRASQHPAIEFFYAHELSHIAHNDVLSSACLTGFLGGVDLLGLRWLCRSFSLSNLTIAVAAYIVQTVALLAFDRYREKQADLKGFSVCSPEGKRAAIEHFQQRVQENIQTRQKLIADSETSEETSFLDRCALYAIKTLATEDGRDYFSLTHPQACERARYLSQMC